MIFSVFRLFFFFWTERLFIQVAKFNMEILLMKMTVWFDGILSFRSDLFVVWCMSRNDHYRSYAFLDFARHCDIFPPISVSRREMAGDKDVRSHEFRGIDPRMITCSAKVYAIMLREEWNVRRSINLPESLSLRCHRHICLHVAEL